MFNGFYFFPVASNTMADAAEKPVGRPMKYPYTFTAKIVQFPWKFYFQNQWVFRYWAFAFVVSLPLFNAIRKLCKLLTIFFSICVKVWTNIFSAYNPANVAKWEEIRRKEREGHH